ncbi:hypothetical protein VTO73DRAFT_4667 [Trametes versicolor]
MDHHAYNQTFDKENLYSHPVTPANDPFSFSLPQDLALHSGPQPGHRRSAMPSIPLQPAFHTPSPSPTASLAELIYRLGRLEMENQHMRHTQSEQRAEINLLRYASIDTLLQDMHRHVAASEMVVRRPDPAAGEVHREPPNAFKEFLQYIKADRSLLPDEEPGTDCLRQARDFPKVLKWWKENSWRAYLKAGRGSSKIGNSTGNQGKTRAANGENVSCLYIEDADGVAVDGHCIRRLREFAANTLTYMKEHKLLLGATRWEDVDVRVRETCVDALRRKFPELQACEENWKTHVFMKEAYYENIGRPPRVRKTEPVPVSLNDAEYVVDDDFNPSPIDDNPPTSLPTATATISSSAPQPKPRPKRKTPPDSETAGAGPSKRPHLTVATDFDDRAPESSSGARYLGLHSAPRDDAVPPPPNQLHSSPTSPDVRPPSPSLQHPAHNDDTDMNDHPVDRVRDENKNDNDPPGDANTGNENRAEGSTVLPPTGKGKKRTPVDIPRTTDDLTHRVLSNPSATPTTHVPPADAAAKPAAGSQTPTSASHNAPPATTKTGPAQAKGKPKAGKPKTKSGGPSTTRVWPPAASEKQPKWVYARDVWLKAHVNGTLEAFEDHYTNDLKENAKRKIARDQKKAASS